MERELIVRSKEGLTEYALLEDGKLTELHRHEDENSFAVGDIFLARAKKSIPGLNAFFLDIGHERNAFLHYHGLGKNIKSLIKLVNSGIKGKVLDVSEDFKLEDITDKDGSIEDILSPKDKILVQITKEPISTKGHRVTCDISLAGRFLVLVPFSDKISVSQKISSQEEQERLKKLVQSIKTKGFGAIVRTVAEGRKGADLHKDFNDIIERWHSIFEKLKNAKAPKKILSELDKSSSILRDIFNDSFVGITVDNQKVYNDIVSYLEGIDPKKKDIVKLYQSQTFPIFDKFGIERQIKTSFDRNVSINKGAYLVIEHTEALHVIDVNSGIRYNKDNDEDSNTALEVNLASAKEIARQLRLRDMGGIIVVDFIDMHNKEDREVLYDAMKENMSLDRAKHKILPLTKFGLMQITRQRVKPQMSIFTHEENPDNKEFVEPPILLVNKIENLIAKTRLRSRKKIIVSVHPFLAAYLNKGLFSIKWKWTLKYKRRIVVKALHSSKYLGYKVFSGKEAK